MLKTYKGWIPTVSGRLSFDLFGKTGYPNPSEYIFKNNNNSKQLYCLQERHSVDIPLIGKKQLDRLFGGSSHVFLLIARYPSLDLVKNGSESELTGTIYFFDRIDTWKAFCDFSSDLDSKPKETSDKSDLESALKEFNNYNNNLRTFEVNITRNGITTVTALLNPILKEINEKYEFIKEELGKKHPIPKDMLKWYAEISNRINIEKGIESDKDEKAEEKILKDIASQELDYIIEQSYFYLRDIGHTHQHHSASDERITALHIVNDDTSSNWILEIAISLYRLALRQKRQKTSLASRRSLGIISYAKSYIEIAEPLIASDSNENYKKYFNDLSKSIKSENLEKSIQNHDNTQETNDIKTFKYFAIIAAILGSLSFLSSYRIDSLSVENFNNIQIRLINSLFYDPIIIIIITALLPAYIIFKDSISNFGKNLVRISLSTKSVIPILTGLISLALALTTYSLTDVDYTKLYRYLWVNYQTKLLLVGVGILMGVTVYCCIMFVSRKKRDKYKLKWLLNKIEALPYKNAPS